MLSASTLTLQGVPDDGVSFHCDMTADVLYLRLADRLDSPAIGEDTADDLVLFRDEGTDEVIGLDVISWWKRFGDGAAPDSLREVQRKLVPLADRLIAEAGIGSITGRA